MIDGIHWRSCSCLLYRASILSLTLSCITTLGAQRFSVSAYAGLEGEAVTTTKNILVEDMVVNGNATAVVDWAFSVQGNYQVNDRLSLHLSIDKRLDYLFGYIIRHPEPPPFNYGTKVGTVGGNDWAVTFTPRLRLINLGRVKVSGFLGLGASRILRYKPAVNGSGTADFGAGYETVTELWNLLDDHPTKTALLASGGLVIDYRRISLQLRYLNTLSRSITDPFTFRGETYPYVNRRDGLQLMVGYTLPIGKRSSD